MNYSLEAQKGESGGTLVTKMINVIFFGSLILLPLLGLTLLAPTFVPSVSPASQAILYFSSALLIVVMNIALFSGLILFILRAINLYKTWNERLLKSKIIYSLLTITVGGIAIILFLSIFINNKQLPTIIIEYSNQALEE